jgi:hypothetical protein
VGSVGRLLTVQPFLEGGGWLKWVGMEERRPGKGNKMCTRVGYVQKDGSYSRLVDGLGSDNTLPKDLELTWIRRGSSLS